MHASVLGHISITSQFQSRLSVSKDYVIDHSLGLWLSVYVRVAGGVITPLSLSFLNS